MYFRLGWAGSSFFQQNSAARRLFNHVRMTSSACSPSAPSHLNSGYTDTMTGDRLDWNRGPNNYMPSPSDFELTAGMLPKVQTGREGKGREAINLTFISTKYYSFHICTFFCGAFCADGETFGPADIVLDSITVVIANG